MSETSDVAVSAEGDEWNDCAALDYGYVRRTPAVGGSAARTTASSSAAS